jgi:hypothetical protein
LKFKHLVRAKTSPAQVQFTHHGYISNGFASVAFLGVSGIVQVPANRCTVNSEVCGNIGD